MNRLIVLVVSLAAAVAVLSLSTASSQPPPAARQSIFSMLKVGESVAVRERGEKYEISTLGDGTPGTHTVAEIGGNFIVLRDVAEVVEVRVPIYSLKAVVHLRTK